MTTYIDRRKEVGNPENAANLDVTTKRLIADGWKKLGQGYFSSVWEHPNCPDTVLKVGTGGPYRINKLEDDKWLDYALSCQKTKSPHAPQVNAIETYGKHYYAEIERLEPLDLDEYFNSGLERCAEDWDTSQMSPSFKAYMRRVERIRKHLGHHPDMHHGNFMRRPSTGEIVCTDPWCAGDE